MMKVINFEMIIVPYDDSVLKPNTVHDQGFGRWLSHPGKCATAAITFSPGEK